jgi:hypothetical protein
MVTLMVVPKEMLHLIAAAPELMKGKINVLFINLFLRDSQVVLISVFFS